MKRSLLMLCGLALLLAACGPKPSDTLDVVFTEFMFTPAAHTVQAGQEITLNITNDGAILHEYAIMKYGTIAGVEYDESDEANIYWRVQVDPGQSLTTTFTAPSEPGEYQVVCGIIGHYTAGMVGTLTVTAP